MNLSLALRIGTALTALPLALIAAEASGDDKPKDDFSTRQSFQVGPEYDSNVLKTFGESDGDGLVRLLFQSKGIVRQPRFSLGWNYQGGGKKYFDRSEQDTLIQLIDVPLSFALPQGSELYLVPTFKFQDESDKVDAAGLDVNEDYLSGTGRLGIRIPLFQLVQGDFFGEFTTFDFETRADYGFERERGSLFLMRAIPADFLAGIGYEFHAEQFHSSPREDSTHEASALFQYSGVALASVRYTYQRCDSNDNRFSYDNHRVTMLLSVPLGDRTPSSPDMPDDEASALFVFHVLGTLQYKQFPAVFGAIDQEGQRFLLTGAEDDNFNSLLVKVTYHPSSWWGLETKYTRYANSLSSQESAFNRSLFYGGVRFRF